jgi:hypothetical protein
VAIFNPGNVKVELRDPDLVCGWDIIICRSNQFLVGVFTFDQGRCVSEMGMRTGIKTLQVVRVAL